MQFRLFYRGPLKANGTPRDKQMIRRAFHPQLCVLWKQPPLSSVSETLLRDSNESPRNGVIQKVNGFSFAPLICSKHHLVAELDILFLRPEEPGKLISQGGDLDNRIKTLFDSLRMPTAQQNEIPKEDKPEHGEDPFFCLLEDDSLVTYFSVRSDRLLIETKDRAEALLIISVGIRGTEKTWLSTILGS
ncbi:MAG: hypothetical protein ACFFCW_40360 [Candidatus Hodarchaeota archaeon]